MDNLIPMTFKYIINLLIIETAKNMNLFFSNMYTTKINANPIFKITDNNPQLKGFEEKFIMNWKNPSILLLLIKKELLCYYKDNENALLLEFLVSIKENRKLKVVES